MGKFASWLYSQIAKWAVDFVNTLIDFLQAAHDALVSFIISLVHLLPDGGAVPAGQAVPTGTVWESVCGAINWLFPVSHVLSCVAFLATGLLLYVAVAPVMRWFKLLT